MSDTIRVRASIQTSDIALRDIRKSVGVKEVSPFTAVTIAAWFQSSGSVGSQLAAFACGAEVSKEALLDDIAATRQGFVRDYDSAESDWLALDMLSTFVINYAGE